MRTVRYLLGVVVLATVAGCTSVVGTWTADRSSSSSNPIASVSFCQDGTFTAHAEYGNNRSHAMSGHYKVEDGQLVLDTEGKERRYGVHRDDDKLTITYKDKSDTLVRMKPRR